MLAITIIIIVLICIAIITGNQQYDKPTKYLDIDKISTIMIVCIVLGGLFGFLVILSSPILLEGLVILIIFGALLGIGSGG